MKNRDKKLRNKSMKNKKENESVSSKEKKIDDTLKDSFPASDPPANY
ncbi:hypothetical protein ACFORL_08910 [Legionella dresdenensis]|uniref:Uncharacterized protein n=1 Tax=Legionella dresdenensis TaxID=450200 RepID=A0ABV8CGS2_9GAMM